MSSVKYNILEKIGIISTARNGSTLELRRVSWFGKDAKLDIRSWNGNELAKSSAKLTLTEEEAKELYNILGKIYNTSYTNQDINNNNNIKGFGDSKRIPTSDLNSLDLNLEIDESELGDLSKDLVIAPTKTPWD